MRSSVSCLWLLALLCYTAPSCARHIPALDDAYAVRSVGTVQLNSSGALLAMEAEGGIVIFAMAPPVKRIEVLPGHHPVWAPNGKLLGFFSGAAQNEQLYVWNSVTRVTERITAIPGGVSPRLSGTELCPPGLSWAPDSKRVVFDTRVMGDFESVVRRPAPTSIRVYDSKHSVDQSLLDGVFQKPSFWDAFAPQQPQLGDRMKAEEIEPELGRNRLIVADILRKTWSVLEGSARHYYSASWSPDGRHIAAVADVTEPYRQTYFAYFSIRKTALSMFNVQSGEERRAAVPAVRMGNLSWSPDGKTLAMVAERHEPILSFTTLMAYSPATGSVTVVSIPQDLAARDFQWSQKGTLVARYWDRFANSLWEINPQTHRSRAIQTFGWQVDSYAQRRNGSFVFNTRSATTRGRVMMTDQRDDRVTTIYDANPQLADLNLGEQRRITWTNKAGDAVDGIIILPPDYRVGERYPLIVCPYPQWPQDILWLSPQYEQIGQLQAARGYVIFRPALRAPHGAYWFTRGEQYTTKARGAAGIPIMVDDFVTGVSYLVKLGIVDPRRVGIFGHSNGGWVANILITETSVVKAAVVASGVNNALLLAFFPHVLTPDGEDPATGGNVFENLNDYVRLSPIFRMRDVRIPLLLLVGNDDWRWLPQMLSQYGVLRSLGKDVELVRYANEGHSLASRNDIEDVLGRVNKFFDTHLMNVGVQ